MPAHAAPTSRTAADCSADDAAEAEVPGDIVRSEDPAAAREKDSSDQPPLSTLSVDEKSFTDFSVDVPNGVFGKGPWGIGWGAWFDSKNASALLPVALVLSFPVYAAVAAPWYAYVRLSTASRRESPDTGVALVGVAVCDWPWLPSASPG